MKPLLFLTSRTFVNFFRRAAKSPQRLIGLLLIGGYYFWYFFRSIFFSGGGSAWQPRPSFRDPALGPPNLPPSDLLAHAPHVNLATVDTTIFWIFAFLSLMLFLSSLTPRGSFRAADVDVLFPTPISPKAVLAFRMVRDGLATLIFPLFFAVAILARPRGNVFMASIRDFPSGGATAMRLFAITYVLMAICFVSIGYAATLFTHRGDEASVRNRRIFNAAVTAVIVGTFGYIGFREFQDPGISTLMEVGRTAGVRVVFFVASAATAVVMSPVYGSPLKGAIGIAALVGITAIGISLTLAQIGYLYDQAAQRTVRMPAARLAQSRNDLYAQAADVARRRKKGKTRSSWLMRRWTPHGPAALIWKDLILQSRTAIASYILFAVIALMFVCLVAATASPRASGGVILGASALTSCMFGVTASTAGFIELLRRGDLQKPLPFSSFQIVSLELVAKAIPALAACVLIGVVGAAIDPASWSAAMAAVIVGPTLALPVLSVGLLVMLFFPDADDAAQRSFRAFVTLVGSVVAAALPVGVGVLLFVLNVSPVILAIPVAVLSIAVAAVTAILSATLYAAFNPSE